MVNSFISAYQKSEFETIPKEEILLKLIEGCIRFLKEAQQKWKEDDKARARELRSRAMAIIAELDNTLDREKGEKEIVEQLDSLYGFMIKEMNRIAVEDDFNKLKDIQEIMEKLYEGFKEASKKLKHLT